LAAWLYTVLLVTYTCTFQSEPSSGEVSSLSPQPIHLPRSHGSSWDQLGPVFSGSWFRLGLFGTPNRGSPVQLGASARRPPRPFFPSQSTATQFCRLFHELPHVNIVISWPIIACKLSIQLYWHNKLIHSSFVFFFLPAGFIRSFRTRDKPRPSQGRDSIEGF
jgi:hypothetical protein